MSTNVEAHESDVSIQHTAFIENKEFLRNLSIICILAHIIENTRRHVEKMEDAVHFDNHDHKIRCGTKDNCGEEIPSR